MASTVSAGTLKVKIIEEIKLNGKDQGGVSTFNIGSIDEVYKRIITCLANNETRIVDFHSSVSDAILTPLDVQDVKYIRVTNLDNSNSLTLSLQIDVGEDDTAADESASILLGAGQSFTMGTPHDSVGVLDANANLVTDLVDLESLIVQPGSNAIDVEILVASAS